MKSKIIFILLPILIIILLSNFVYGEEGNRYIKNYGFNEDIKLKNIIDSYRYYFNINENWNVQEGSFLNLIFSRTDIDTKENSTLTVLLNGEEIYSTLIYNKKILKEELIINLPNEKFNKGSNELQIKTYHRISDNPCEEENPGNWIILNKESFVHIKYTKVIDSTDIRDFPYPYVEKEDDNPIKTTILLPSPMETKDIKHSMMMAALLGKRGGNNDIKINMAKIENKASYEETHSIYIGSKNNIMKDWLIYLTKDELEKSKEEAIIKEISAPYNRKKKLLLILSENDKALEKAINLLSYDTLIDQIKNNTQIVRDDLEFISKERTDKEKIVFEDLGYNSFLLEGLLNQRVFLEVDIPNNWRLKNGSKIHLNTRYSEFLDFEESGVTIYINGVPIGSKALELSKAQNDGFEIDIPEDMLEYDYFSIEINYYLKLPNDDCLFNNESSSWVSVSNDSYLYFPHDDKKVEVLENYPSPFVIDYQFDDAVFVLPDNPNIKDINRLGNIVGYLGKELEKFDNIEIITASEVNEYIEKKMIIIGTPQSNNLIKELNEKLYIKFDSNYEYFLTNEQISFVDDYSSDLGSIQLIKKNGEENSKLIITGTTEEALSRAVEYITRTDLTYKLMGNAMVIDNMGIEQSGYFEILDYNEENKINDSEIIEEKNPNIILMLFTITTLGIISAIIFVTLKYKK